MRLTNEQLKSICFGALRSSHTHASVANRRLSFDAGIQRPIVYVPRASKVHRKT